MSIKNNDTTRLGFFGWLFVVLLTTGCASLDATTKVTYDPWEPLNRKVHATNSVIDQNLVKPIVKVYESLAPSVIESGVENFFSNLSDVGHLFNHCLQFNVDRMAIDTARLLINSTIGLAGFVDVAADFGFYQQSTDFGHTLGLWGVSSGPYLVLPLMGPSTLRDGAGMILDAKFNPLNDYDPVAHQALLYGLQAMDIRRQIGDFDTYLLDDSYVFLREAYLQQRAYLIHRAPLEDQFDDF
jgi:phospholipid-binding lipoprotein MlaA